MQVIVEALRADCLKCRMQNETGLLVWPPSFCVLPSAFRKPKPPLRQPKVFRVTFRAAIFLRGRSDYAYRKDCSRGSGDDVAGAGTRQGESAEPSGTGRNHAQRQEDHD